MGYFLRKYVAWLFLIGKIFVMLPSDGFNSHVAHFKLTFQLCFGRIGGNGHVKGGQQVRWIDGQNWDSESKIKGFDCGRWERVATADICQALWPYSFKAWQPSWGKPDCKGFDFACPPATCAWEKPQGHSWLNSCLCTTPLTWLWVLCLPTSFSSCVCKAQSQQPMGLLKGGKITRTSSQRERGTEDSPSQEVTWLYGSQHPPAQSTSAENIAGLTTPDTGTRRNIQEHTGWK